MDTIQKIEREFDLSLSQYADGEVQVRVADRNLASLTPGQTLGTPASCYEKDVDARIVLEDGQELPVPGFYENLQDRRSSYPGVSVRTVLAAINQPIKHILVAEWVDSGGREDGEHYKRLTIYKEPRGGWRALQEAARRDLLLAHL